MDICLIFNNTEIPLTKGSYSEKREYVDNRNVTEAGHTVREVVRTGIVTLSVSLVCDSEEKQVLDGFADESALSVIYWSEKTGTLENINGFIDGYSANLKVDADERFYDVSFEVREL